ncbi:uncharacterized protein LOC131299631 [Rhododendron vialii]|uniref:uncharacterized protein LOC131299631 n=1 Tax=Rhododendron vialii TaxID=182163 RepID=UPI00265DA49D|nr:uncharacterized protein LOC131299631 [Rhododendron vialii]
MSREHNLDTSNWKRLEEGTVKINVDVAVSKELNVVGTDVIATGADGVILGVSIKTHVGISSSRIVEALTVQGGLYMGLALNLFKVIVEYDAEAIVTSCVATKTLAKDIAVLVHDCQAFKGLFLACDFYFVKCEYNQAAHVSARKVLSGGSSELWTTTLPTWDSIISDV